MLVKDTCLFVINKYKEPHTYVNHFLNRNHHQLDSNLVVAHIKGIIKAQFTLFAATIQASVIEKLGYEISYKKALGASSAYHRICMSHLASNFMTYFKDKLLENLVCRAALATTQRKFNRHMATIWRINSKAQQWLEAIPLKL